MNRSPRVTTETVSNISEISTYVRERIRATCQISAILFAGRDTQNHILMAKRLKNAVNARDRGLKNTLPSSKI